MHPVFLDLHKPAGKDMFVTIKEIGMWPAYF